MAKKQFKTESKRVLDLMINSIYTNREIFLREIISNASDAIDKLCYISLTDDKVGLNRDDFRITVSLDKDARRITVSDNGIGMTADELEQNLGTIAKSGSLQFKKDIEGSEATDTDIIGQFGVGFYSAFMVASKVAVITRSYGEEKGHYWVSEGADGYTIKECEKEKAGTDVVMELKPDTDDEKFAEFLDEFVIKNLIKKYSDYIRWPIVLGDETVNSRVPIWQRPKSEVSDEDCIAFYKEKFYDSKDPVSVIRINAEGAVSYKAMLFIPEAMPYGYYTTAHKTGLSLYASGVMIMDKCAELLPECFRFVCGVVDSPDLTLNISRETLQHDRQLKIIAANIEKKVRAELARLITSEPEKYEEFYKSFGLQLKYGVVADFGAKKDQLSDLLMFVTEKSGKLKTLDNYVSEMPEEQKYIYYACAESAAVAAGLPQAEPVRLKGYDILYLTDHVDEFVMSILGTYKEKQLKSVSDEELGLESDEEKREIEKLEDESDALLNFVVEANGGRLADARISKKLKTHPVCLTARGPVSIEMERGFASRPEAEAHRIKAERVLEINAAHPVFAVLRDAFENDPEKAARYAKLLYAQAELTAGLMPEDPSEFADLVCGLMI